MEHPACPCVREGTASWPRLRAHVLTPVSVPPNTRWALVGSRCYRALRVSMSGKEDKMAKQEKAKKEQKKKKKEKKEQKEAK